MALQGSIAQGGSMNQGKLVFAQLMQHLPLSTFRRCVTRYRGEFKVQSFSCLNQFLCMTFAQLTYRESLRDIEVCLRAQRSKLYHFGIRSTVAHRRLRLRFGRHRQKASQSLGQPLRNPTDPQPDHVRARLSKLRFDL